MRQKMRAKKVILGTVVLVLIVLTIAYLRNRSHGKESKTHDIVVAKGEVTEKVTAMGLLVPRVTINIKSPIRGSVTTLYAEEGQAVHKGDKLLEVKPEPTPEEYARYKQSLALAQSKEQNQKKNLQRIAELWQKKLVANQEYDAAKQQFDEAVLDRKLAEQNINLIEKGTALVGNKQIQNSLTSPIDGYILKRNVEIGDAVVSLSDPQAGTTLFTIAQMKDIVFKGAVNEIDVGKIHDNMKAEVLVGALPNEKLEGTVKKIALQAEGFDPNISFKDEEQKQARFRLDVDNLAIPTDITIRAGLSATADIELATVKDVIVIPERVLHYDEEKPYVLLRDPQTHHTEKHEVVVGLSDGVNTEITSGLKIGDHLSDSMS